MKTFPETQKVFFRGFGYWQTWEGTEPTVIFGNYQACGVFTLCVSDDSYYRNTGRLPDDISLLFPSDHPDDELLRLTRMGPYCGIDGKYSEYDCRFWVDESQPLTFTVIDTAQQTKEVAPRVGGVTEPWLIHNQIDPAPKQPWYIPARYFAREEVGKDPSLLENTKTNLLAGKVAKRLSDKKIKPSRKPNGSDMFKDSTIKKAFYGVDLKKPNLSPAT